MQADASDEFILVPLITPGGLGQFAGTVLLQNRGVFGPRIRGSTLREHLGLALSYVYRVNSGRRPVR